MQQLPGLTRQGGIRKRVNPNASFWLSEPSAGVHLPFSHHVDDHTVATRDGILLQVIHLAGFLFETADTDTLNYRKALRDSMIQALSSSRFALYHHVVRRRVLPLVESEFPDPFSKQLDAAWRSRLDLKALYTNDLYLTIVRRPNRGASGFARVLSKFLRKSADGNGLAAQDLRALDAAREALVASLSCYGARTLTAYDTEQGSRSEVLEFFSSLYNGELRPVALPHEEIGQYLPYRRISFGQNTVEMAPIGDLPRFMGIASVKDYPQQTFPGMFDDLLRLPFELTLTQSFASVERPDALSRVNLTLRRMRASDDEALSLRSDLSAAKDEVAAGRASFGEHHLTVAIRGETPKAVDDAISEVQASMTDLGIVSVREDTGLEPAFWAQFPGNFKYIARRGLVSSRNFASLFSGHNFPTGKPDKNHWGQAVSVLETTAAGPYYFNFHQGDLGNFTIIGPSGSGKTVVLNFLLAQARKYRPKIVFFDKDRGAELFIRAIGGRYDVLRPGIASGLNPLLLPDTAQNRSFLMDWLTALAGGTAMTPEEQLRIRDVIDANYLAPLHHRRLRHTVELFRGGHRPHEADLSARLRPWWGEGEHAWLFDNADDTVSLEADSVGFDMTRILDEPKLRTPAMMYLFHRVEERLDGTPSIIVVDEGWKALDDDIFVQRIKDWEKTIRKRNGIVGFATQSAEDALQSRIASAIVEQAATQIFMANPKAQARDYVDGFGLTEHEYELVRSLPDTSRCFLIKHGIDSVVARLNLAGESNILTILSGRERTVRLLDEIRLRTGDDPELWLAELLERA